MLVPFFFLSQFNGAFEDAKENGRLYVTDHLLRFEPDFYAGTDIEVLQRTDFAQLKREEGIEDVYFTNRYPTNNILIHGKLSIGYSVFVVDEDINDIWKNDWILTGKWWERGDQCVIGLMVSQKSKLNVGDSIEIEGKSYEISGISNIPAHRKEIIIGEDAIKDLKLWDATYYVKTSNNIEGAKNTLNNWLIKKYGSYKIDAGKEINLLAYQGVTKGWGTSIVLSLISLVYSMINVYNVLYFYTIKSRKKLGVTMALGARKGQIIVQKYFEIGINMIVASILSYIGLYFLQKTPIQFILSIKVNGIILCAMLVFGQLNALGYTFLLLRKTFQGQIADIFRN